MRCAAVCAALLLAACTGEIEQQVGYFEPLRVPDGALIEEDLTQDPDGPAVTALEAGSGIVNVGQRDRTLGGRTTADAYAIAVRFEDLGSGWWVRPVDDLDPMLWLMRLPSGVSITRSRSTSASHCSVITSAGGARLGSQRFRLSGTRSSRTHTATGDAGPRRPRSSTAATSRVCRPGGAAPPTS